MVDGDETVGVEVTGELGAILVGAVVVVVGIVGNGAGMCVADEMGCGVTLTVLTDGCVAFGAGWEAAAVVGVVTGIDLGAEDVMVWVGVVGTGVEDTACGVACLTGWVVEVVGSGVAVDVIV